jgi:hypothetical protein
LLSAPDSTIWSWEQPLPTYLCILPPTTLVAICSACSSQSSFALHFSHPSLATENKMTYVRSTLLSELLLPQPITLSLFSLLPLFWKQ